MHNKPKASIFLKVWKGALGKKQTFTPNFWWGEQPKVDLEQTQMNFKRWSWQIWAKDPKPFQPILTKLQFCVIGVMVWLSRGYRTGILSRQKFKWVQKGSDLVLQEATRIARAEKKLEGNLTARMLRSKASHRRVLFCRTCTRKNVTFEKILLASTGGVRHFLTTILVRAWLNFCGIWQDTISVLFWFLGGFGSVKLVLAVLVEAEIAFFVRNHGIKWNEAMPKQGLQCPHSEKTVNKAGFWTFRSRVYQSRRYSAKVLPLICGERLNQKLLLLKSRTGGCGNTRLKKIGRKKTPQVTAAVLFLLCVFLQNTSKVSCFLWWGKLADIERCPRKGQPLWLFLAILLQCGKGNMAADFQSVRWRWAATSVLQTQKQNVFTCRMWRVHHSFAFMFSAKNVVDSGWGRRWSRSRNCTLEFVTQIQKCAVIRRWSVWPSHGHRPPSCAGTLARCHCNDRSASTLLSGSLVPWTCREQERDSRPTSRISAFWAV